MNFCARKVPRIPQCIYEATDAELRVLANARDGDSVVLGGKRYTVFYGPPKRGM